MSAANDLPLLKGVSRSFYLTLRLLPAPMRRAASLGYLLARTSDTLADAIPADPARRVEALDKFAGAVAGGSAHVVWPREWLDATPDARERELLRQSTGLLAALQAMPAAEAALIREVVATIIAGQQLDLQRFGPAGPGRVVALPDAAALDDYTWRVAGCVGAFWTRLGRLTMGEGFAAGPPEELLQRGVAYGKGLQLVNILRDLPADLASGRCYLPVADVGDRGRLLEAHQQWLQQARVWVAEGFTYAAALRTKRLRAATVLPAMLARETLARMQGATWQALQARIKVPRARVYQMLVRALVGAFPG